MFCENCGNELPEGASFCAKCGSRMVSELKASSAMSGESVATESGEKTGSISLYAIMSVVLCVVISLLGISASMIYLIRQATSEDAIDSMVKEIDISEIKVEFLENEKVSTIADFISNYYNEDVSSDQIETLLNKKFVRKFVAEKLNVYVEDLFYETGDGIIEEKELKELLIKNADDITKITGFRMSEDDAQLVIDDLKKNGILENTDLSVYRENNPRPFSLIKNSLSYWMMALLLIFSLLLMVSIFLIQDKKIKGLCFMSASLIAIGIGDLLAGIMSSSLVTTLNRNLELGRKFWQQVFMPVRTTGIRLGIIMIVLGVICCLIYILIKVINEKNVGVFTKIQPKK